jgi:calcineurin-like phosphoesterase
VRDRRGFDDNIYNIPYICRPANLPKINPRKCSLSIKVGIIKVGVFVVLGQCFLKICASNPSKSADELIK